MAATSTIPRVILVTGASSGIGRACAIGLSNAFPSATEPRPLVLVLSGRRKEELEATANECREGTITEIAVGDVSHDDDVDRMFATIREKYGRLDVLFNVRIALVRCVLAYVYWLMDRMRASTCSIPYR
jgi:NADP-dependent 3-hydroxy acid dehydrogenase YdfG